MTPAADPTSGYSAGLRVAPARVRLWALALAVFGLLPILSAPAELFHDFSAFWSAGATVGTADLVDAARHTAWQLARSLPAAFWSYPPATAWLYWPLAQLPLSVGFWVNAATMLVLAVVSGAVAARTYGLPTGFVVLAALAWAPNTASVVLGQNAPLGLLLALVAIYALATNRPWLAGLAVGALLYKPTLALGLLVLLAVRGEWRALLAAAVVAAGLFLASIAGAGGDVYWLATWLAGASTWLPADAAGNLDKAISLPGLVSGLLPGPTGLVVGGVAFALALPGLRRAGIVEAASAACLLGIAFGPRSWGYDAALMFPFICWLLAGGMAEPWRTRAVVGAFVLAVLWPWSWAVGFSPVAIPVLGAAGWWVGRWLGNARSPARRQSGQRR